MENEKTRKKNRFSFRSVVKLYFQKDEDMNTQLLDLADIVINNRPLLANFEEIASIGEVNHAISFYQELYML